MSENEEEGGLLLICFPVAWDPEGKDQIPGTSGVYQCAECEQPVYVAPSGQRLVSGRNAQPVCVPCSQTVIKRENSQLGTPTDDQMQELREAILRDRL